MKRHLMTRDPEDSHALNTPLDEPLNEHSGQRQPVPLPAGSSRGCRRVLPLCILLILMTTCLSMVAIFALGVHRVVWALAQNNLFSVIQEMHSLIYSRCTHADQLVFNPDEMPPRSLLGPGSMQAHILSLCRPVGNLETWRIPEAVKTQLPAEKLGSSRS